VTFRQFVQNGYALCTRAGLDAIAQHLRALPPEQIDILRGKLCIGIHLHVRKWPNSAELRGAQSRQLSGVHRS
jgi:hypothetical protein